jgi:CheY-like chemotaxis protein
MDYKLPVMDGHSAAKVISNFTRNTVSPTIVALTSLPERLREDESGETSVFAAIEEKPWDPRSLIETLDFFERTPSLFPDDVPPSPAGVFEAAGLLAPDLRREIALLSGHRPPGPARILIAEDDELMRSLLTAALDARCYDVDAVPNGLDALIKLGQRQYDVALMDYRLPKIDGLVAAQLVRDVLPRIQRPRLIALTSSPKLVREEDEGPPFAFDAVISKDMDLRHILGAIERSLDYHEQDAIGAASPN